MLATTEVKAHSLYILIAIPCIPIRTNRIWFMLQQTEILSR